jgi:O-antigen/teichoic acid export membrane protein
MLGKNLVASVFTQVPVFILGVISGVYSTRILGDDAKGAFSLFQANAHLFVLVFSLGIRTGIVYFISSKKISEGLVSGMSIFIFIISSLVLILLLLLGHILNLTSFILPEGYNSLFYLMTLFLMYLLSFINSIMASFFQAHSSFKVINTLSLVNSVMNVVIFTVLFFTIESQSLDAITRFNYIIYATLLALFLNTLLWLLIYKKTIYTKPDFKFDTNDQLKKFISYNTSIYIGMFINFFNYRLDLWIVNHFLSDKDLSYYSLAANINQIILYIAVTIGSVMLPNLSSRSEEERLSAFVRVSRICFVFFTGLCLVAYLVCGFVIPFMYGSAFESTIIPFRILLPGILFSSITQLFSIFIVSINKNKFNILACAAGLVITVILDIILIPAYGINGAAIATTFSYFAIFVITYILILNETNRYTFNFFFPLVTDVKILLNLMVTKRNINNTN